MTTPERTPPGPGRKTRTVYFAVLLVVVAAIVVICAVLPRPERGSVLTVLMWLFAALDVLILIPAGRHIVREFRGGSPRSRVVRVLAGLVTFGIVAAAVVVFVGVACFTLTFPFRG